MAKQTIRDDSIGKVIDEIGTGGACFTQQQVDMIRDTLLASGWGAAEAQAAQFMGTDAYTEILRIVQTMRKHNLSPEAGADILNNLFQIKSGHY